MSAEPHPLDQLLEEARVKLTSAEREARDARIEIATLEKAKAALSKQSAPSTPASLSRQAISPTERPSLFRAQNGAIRRRSLSGTWQQILRKMDEHGESDLDAILGYSSEIGHEIERASLRGQMFNYVKRGFLERPRDGVFQVTPEGRKAAGISARPGNSDASANSTEAS